MSKLLAGRYELIEKIGEGGMAVVYKGKDRLLNRYVAIKILRPEYTKDAQFIENFRNESQSAAGLQHPNIVSVYDVGQEGSIHFIVMELIDGKPLSDLINEEAPFDYKRTIEITKQVASALSLAHKHNIIHRDVKPHNIMITEDGVAKLADFGIAKAVSDSTAVNNETSRIIGSVHYFSPEQARGAYVDERSDIYSLGIVIYEMLTGKVPFDGENPVQVALMHINNDIIPPSKLVGGIPPALEQLVMKATDKFQANRYRNAEELIEDLQDVDFITRRVGKSVFIANDDFDVYADESPELSVDEPKKGKKTKADKSEVLEEKESEDTLEKNDKKKEKKKDKKKSDKKTKKDSTNNNKKKKIAIVAGVVALLVIIVVALNVFGVIGGKIAVPDLSEMTKKQATKELKKVGLEIEIGEPITSEDVEKDLVAGQSPEAYSKAKKGDTVVVYLSAGKPTGEVPSLVGRMYDRELIAALLESNGYVLGSVDEVEDDAPEGEIISQDPSSGIEAEKGTYVSIIVSKGTSKLIVPTIVGHSLDEAKDIITDAGFSLGRVRYDESNVYAKDIVMDAEYDAGEKLEKGTKIDIVVSKGIPEVTPPPADEPDEPIDIVDDNSQNEDDVNQDDQGNNNDESTQDDQNTDDHKSDDNSQTKPDDKKPHDDKKEDVKDDDSNNNDEPVVQPDKPDDSNVHVDDTNDEEDSENEDGEDESKED